ncbi:MAG: dockerin type I repeat-containing protein, partial [Anaeroplasmataceae bacterium]|nr:dockerin type I repeat-containing protein [Anaeroplasmataceae bacterium]
TVYYTGTIPALNANVPYIYLNNTNIEVGDYDLEIYLEDLTNQQWSDGSDEHTRTIKLHIIEKDIAAANVNYTRLESQSYTGAEIKPEIHLFYRGYKLVEGVDFIVTFENNVEVFSTAVATIEGIGNFTGTIVDTFFIDSQVLRLIDSTTYSFVTATSETTFVEGNHSIYDPYERTIIKNVKSQTTITEFINQFIEVQRDYIKIYDGKSFISASQYDTTYIGTGMIVVFTNAYGTTIDMLYVSVLGDINGDGYINMNDATKLMQGMGRNLFTYEQFLAADVNKDGIVNFNDYSYYTRHTSGQINIDEIEA